LDRRHYQPLHSVHELNQFINQSLTMKISCPAVLLTAYSLLTYEHEGRVHVQAFQAFAPHHPLPLQLQSLHNPPLSITATATKHRPHPLYASPPNNNNNNNNNDSNNQQQPFNDVVAEAEAALKEAEKALLNMNPSSSSSSSDSSDSSTNQLIDIDAMATADEQETMKIIQKLATGKLAAGEATSKLIQKSNDIQTQQLQAMQNEKDQRAQASRDARQLEIDTVKNDAVAAAVGGVAFGVLTGALLDVYFAMMGNGGADIGIEPIIPPAALGVSLGAAAFGLASQEDNGIGQAIRKFVGGFVKALANAVTSAVSKAVSGAVEEVRATPDKIKTAVNRQIQETTEEIKLIPGKVKEAASQTAEGISNEIQLIPGKVKDTALSTAEKAKGELESAAKKFESDIEIAASKALEEVRATPGRVVKDVEGRIETFVGDTRESISEVVDEVVALPGKTLDEVSLRFKKTNKK